MQCLSRFIPESPFWLSSHQMGKEAKDVLSHMAVKNGKKPLDQNIVIIANDKLQGSGSGTDGDCTNYHVMILVIRTFFVSVIW